MEQVYCIVINHPRLDFKNSHIQVSDFVNKRLHYAGISDVTIVPNKSEAERHINDIRGRNNKYIVVCDIMNPFLDITLVQKMVTRLTESVSYFCVSDGAIPGTQPECVIKPGYKNPFSWNELYNGTITSIKQRWYTQATQNNQFNLYKYKRLKMFLGLIRTRPDIYKYTIENLCSLLKDDQVFNLLIAYCEQSNLTELKNCPYCSGELQPLTPTMSQPFCGYLTPTRPYYFECQRCGLISLSPVMEESTVELLYDEFDKQDFVQSLNNPYQANSPRCDFSSFIQLLPPDTHSLDLGGGIGKFSQFLKQQYPRWDVTHSDFEIKANKHMAGEGIHTRALNFLNEEIGYNEYDFITAWEVVEHIPMKRFSEIINKIYRALKKGGFFVFSTPDFDSPLCQAYDFFNACPPFHYTVFSTQWLQQYFSDKTEWQFMEPRYNSDFLDDAVNWFEYASKTSPTFQLRSLSKVLKALFSSEYADNLKQHLLSKGWGTEVIITLRKK